MNLATLLPTNKEINEKVTYCKKKLSFTNLIKLCKEKYLTLPPEQGALNEDSINEMVEDYLSDKAYFYCRNSIVIGVMKHDKTYKYMVVDGQHRINMAKILNEEHDEDNIFNVSFKYCENRSELKKLFDKMNMDSRKNEYLLALDKDSDELLKEIKETLKSEYQTYFAKSASKEKKIFTIDEFIKIISKEKKFLEKFSYAKEFVKYLIKKNKEFNKNVNGIGYHQLKINDENQFYNDELKIMENMTYYTFGFKNNNFITDEQYLFNKNVVSTHHTFKKSKGNTEISLRKKVWKQTFGDKKEGICPVYLCKNKIYEDNFITGHIISEANGGDRTTENLKPMCNGCSTKMGKTNWDEYERKLKQNRKNKKYESETDSNSDSDSDSNDD